MPLSYAERLVKRLKLQAGVTRPPLAHNLQRHRRGTEEGLLYFSRGEEEEAMCEDRLTALGTWAALGRFEWSRAKIVYSERKAGSAIIPASS